MSLKILAIRHAATNWNQQKRFQGRRDIPLNDAGRTSLQGKTIPVDYQQARWYSSPLLRARQTAELLSAPEFQQEVSLIEMDWGDWEGQRLADLRAELGTEMEAAEALGLDLQPPGGESPRHVRQRVLNWLQSLTPEGKIGIVCHKGVLRALLSEALQWDMREDCPIKIRWDQALLFSYHPDSGLQLTEYNLPLDT